MNQSSAYEAQVTSRQMTRLTREMHQIARKTEEKTLSMTIITLVTLFILPGFFISTLMSTDIIRFKWGEDVQIQKSYSLAVLKLWLKICIPLMVVTLLVWLVGYYWLCRMEAEARAAKGSRQSSRQPITQSNPDCPVDKVLALFTGPCHPLVPGVGECSERSRLDSLPLS